MSKSFALTLLLIFFAINCAYALDSATINACHQPSTHHFIDISQSVIEKTKKMQFHLQLFDSPVAVNRSKTGLILSGKFSKLILKRNGQQKSEQIYYGKEMHIKVPPNHVFSLQKIPQLEIQIIHESKQPNTENAINIVILSQIYVVSKFTNKIETVLSSYINPQLKQGDVIPTEKLIKIIEGFPMLMYQGSAQTYPCRKDLLCFIKRQYQLISEDDFREIKAFLNVQNNNNLKKKAFRRNKLLEVPAMKRPIQTTTEIDQQL